MKINEVLDKVKVLVQRNNFSIKEFDLCFANEYIFNGSCFLIPGIEDALCYDAYKNSILYLPNINAHYDDFVVINENDENDKSFMFNIMVQTGLSTDNIETFKNVVQLYNTVLLGRT